MNIITKILCVFLVVALAICSFMSGFLLNRSEKSYDFDNIILIPESENPKYQFLKPEISDYICALCDGLNLDSDLAVAHLLVENPDFNPDAIHKNDNGTLDLGLFQLNDKYLWTTFKDKYWFDNVELDPFNWKHNTYIALHLMADLNREFKVQDDAIMAYNGGRGNVMNGTVKPETYDYLRKVKNNLWLIKNQKEELAAEQEL